MVVDMDPKTVGRRIKLLRQSKNWSLEELEKHCGVSHSTLSLYEQGKIRRMRAENLQKIARAFSLTFEELTREDIPDGLLKKLGAEFSTLLLKRVAQLSPEGRKSLFDYLEFLLERERRDQGA